MQAPMFARHTRVVSWSWYPPSITVDTYSHVAPTVQKAAAKRYAALLGGA